jgi:hypothetical protein
MRRAKSTLAASIAAVVISVGVLGAGALWSEATQSSIKVCVNKTTKVVKYKNKCNTNERVLRLSLRGEAGKSAYQIWLDQGFRGSERDFLNFLRGASGASAQDFARSCFQQLQKASAQGIFWNTLSDRRNFERQTGCSVREINLNPNAHAESEAPIWPQVLSTMALGLYGGAGGDHIGGQFIETRGVIYSAKLRLPSDYRACSAAVPGASRALYGDSLNELYLQGTVKSTLTTLLSELAVGYGTYTDELVYPENNSGVREIQLGQYTVRYFAPWSIPLGQSAEVSILELLENGAPANLDDYQISVRAGLGEGLAKLEQVATAGDAIKTYSLTSNPREYGSINLEIAVYQNNFDYEVSDNFLVGLGVDSCTSEASNDPFGPYSWLYQMHEDPAVLSLGSAEPKLAEIGWLYPDWFFVPDPEED